MTHDEKVKLFIAILSAHPGMGCAISVAEMASRLGFERDKTGQRQAQEIKRAVVERGVLVGSSCGKSHGWYRPVTNQEIQATLGQYKARIRSLVELIKMTEGAAGVKAFVGELALEFEKEVTV